MKKGAGAVPTVTFYRDEAMPFLEGKRCLANDFAYHKHFHEEYSIGLIDSGATNAWCDGTMLRVEAGNVISFPPLMLHACHPEEGVEWQYKMLFVKPDWFEGLEQRTIDQLHIPYLLGGLKNESCRIRLNRVMEALSGHADPLETETALVELIQALVLTDADDLRHERRNRQDRKYVTLMQEYIHAHYTERITLEELERIAGISKFHLIRMFKQWSHLPPHAYQNLLRINHAKTQLAKQRPIAEIADEAGFYDQSHFSRTFSRIVGTTPNRYAATN
ncbi:AraC-like DNA-binding protein [Paenibacillus phyllosphaerae]|uniref:AraC-like DNA-binding protein n=1 Tax=Paenibacillus phyllosphaerae TaxID=274593 RepID=A0A7W5AU91_9BACL|nr:AraC family transcriptional regulator [Paenibacillus phyllosphaerae]MBB3108885.1 AraC-like DNA-binding protein [Paenibacillus phyllosphaerae]